MRKSRRAQILSLAILLAVGSGLLVWLFMSSRQEQVRQEKEKSAWAKQQQEAAETESQRAQREKQKQAEGQNAGAEPGDPKNTEDESGTGQKGTGEGGNGTKNAAGGSTGVTLAFAGDILLSSYVTGNYDRSGMEGVVSDSLRTRIQQADIFMANQEFPFSEGGTQAEDKQFTFRVKPSYTVILKELGVDVVTLANNHALDYGKQALSDTFTALEQAGIHYVGAGDTMERAAQPYLARAEGRTFGFLAASRVIPEVSWNVENQQPGIFCTYDSAKLVQAIQETKKSCDYLAVYVHWGIERENTPQEYQRTLAKAYIDAGADLVIGAHPHVLQGIEYYQGKPIVYSLGNFLFNREISSTVLLEAEVTPENQTVLRLIPAYASGAKTQEMEGEAAEKLYRFMEEISFGVTVHGDGTVQGQ